MACLTCGKLGHSSIDCRKQGSFKSRIEFLLSDMEEHLENDGIKEMAATGEWSWQVEGVKKSAKAEVRNCRFFFMEVNCLLFLASYSHTPF